MQTLTATSLYQLLFSHKESEWKYVHMEKRELSARRRKHSEEHKNWRWNTGNHRGGSGAQLFWQSAEHVYCPSVLIAQSLVSPCHCFPLLSMWAAFAALCLILLLPLCKEAYKLRKSARGITERREGRTDAGECRQLRGNHRLSGRGRRLSPPFVLFCYCLYAKRLTKNVHT